MMDAFGTMSDSLLVCNAILSPREQDSIMDAAVNANEGYDIAAERIRREANYHNIGFRQDADYI